MAQSGDLDVKRQVTWGMSAYVFLLTAALGIVSFLKYRRLVDALPIVWLAVAFLVLIFHRPFWDHQAVILAIPLAWLSGISVGILANPKLRRLHFATTLVFIGAMTAAGIFPLLRDAERSAGYLPESPLIVKNQEFRGWAITDNVMDAYRAKWLVPPELAVFSAKRVHSGALSDRYIVNLIEVYQPQEVVYRRFTPSRELLAALGYDYKPAPNTRGYLHAIRLTQANNSFADAGREELVAAITIAVADLSSHGVEGGYAGLTDLRTGERFGRSKNEPLEDDEIVTRPPGSTQQVGRCMRQIHRVTGDDLFRSLAISTGRSLACAQRYGGGWGKASPVRTPCGGAHKTEGKDRERMSIDDGSTPSAAEFLIDLDADFRNSGELSPVWLKSAIPAALGILMEAQAESGGWPQTFPGERDEYSANFTFNDGAISSVIAVLLKAYKEFGERQYLDAALHGGDFILATQGPDGQAGWAAQYGRDMKPAAGRKYEPVGYSSRETGDVLNSLLDLYAATGDERYAAAITKARAWLDNVTIRPETWAWFYEVGTNKPIYGDRDGSVHYNLAEISEERRNGYDWERRFPSVVKALRRDDARLAGGVEGLKLFDEQSREPVPLSRSDRRDWPKSLSRQRPRGVGPTATCSQPGPSSKIAIS